jgi:hypothetical protein
MSRATLQMRNFAKRLIADEPNKNRSGSIKNPVDFSACEKLRLNLLPLMGRGGYHALLSRAVALAQAEVPLLHAVRVKADGTLETIEEHQAQGDELFEGRLVLLAQLLGLLVAFIGNKVTLSLVREVWPKAKLDGLELGTEAKNEKNKISRPRANPIVSLFTNFRPACAALTISWVAASLSFLSTSSQECQVAVKLP